MLEEEIILELRSSPIITETFAFYDLFYGDFGIVRRNLTEGIESAEEAAPVEEIVLPEEEQIPAEDSEAPAAEAEGEEEAGFLQTEGEGAE